eukprot:g43685.t1
MVEGLNRCFASVFILEDASNIPELQESHGAQMSVMAISMEKVLGRLKGLNLDNSPGLGGLHRRVLKEIAEKIMEASMVIFQKSLESGRGQDDWNMANVRQKTGNYRPVSLTLDSYLL